MDPFLEPRHFEDAARIIREAMADMQPFEITLETFGYFVHKKSCTLYLGRRSMKD
jgi:hypothetical protein